MPEPKGPDARTVTNDAHIVSVDLDVSDLTTRLEREALRLINDLSQQGIEGDELAEQVQAGLASLSDAPIDRAARGATSESFNLGRNLAAQDRVGEVAEVVRSEVLDANTCRPCRALDGTTYRVNTPAYFEFMPPNKCDGRELCRGFYLYLRAA